MYNAAIVGCGRIASLLDDDPKRKFGVSTHAGSYKAHPETELIAAADINIERLSQFKEKWNVKNLYSEYREMFGKEKIDILSICTWSSTHLEICQRAIEKGIKAIFCEKPLTLTLEEADKLVNLCKKNNTIFAVNHSRRWDDLHCRLKNYIEEGNLGQIQAVSAYYTGGIANTGTHLLDILRFIFGDVLWVSANFEARGQQQDPSVDAYLYFKQGFGALVSGLDVNNYLMFEIDIYGSRGRLRIENSGFKASLWEVGEHPLFSGYKSLGEKKIFMESGLRDMMVNAIKDLVVCLKEAKKPQSSVEDGRAALELISAIYESGKNRAGQKVFLPLERRDILVVSR